MDFQKYTALSKDKLSAEFKVSIEAGLNSDSIKKLQISCGRNVFEKNEIGWVEILGRQFKSAFIYLLIFAAVITFLLGERLDSVFILVFITINVALGFFQEYKSEQTIKLLRRYTNRKATVIRDGREINIDAADLVPGDIVLIETGDIVPADMRLVEINALQVDESTLTGESIHVLKQADSLPREETDLFKATNIAFSGTTVVEGRGTGVVVATGRDSQFGKIAHIATTVEGTSAFEKHIDKFSKFILFLTIITLAVVFVVHILIKDTLSVVDLLVFSIALAVGVIPEGMPLVTTFSLSLGAAKLAKEKVIVKRLSAIQDLGEIEILCTDKTGTITENKLEVSDIYSENREETLGLAMVAASSFDTQGNPNNSFDLAMFKHADNSLRLSAMKAKRIFEIPFNPNRRRNSVLAMYNQERMLIVRGSAEAILPHVTGYTPVKKQKLLQWIETEGYKGRRVIAIARKNCGFESYTVRDEEGGLRFCGAISFTDPIKATTPEAIRKATRMGIRTVMITGDSPQVAAAVGVNAGIAKKIEDVITGNEFEALSRHKQLQVARNINVFARMSPEQKYNLIRILQENSEVGYLGEGINDAPAIKAAAVSIVVDNASDISREAADIILLEHNLKVIVDGIELGRKTFVNVTNYIKATLSSNFGNFYAMVFVTLVIDYLPMLPIQVLLVNLLSDFPMISIASDNVGKEEIRSPKKLALREFLLAATMLGIVSTFFDFVMFGVFKNEGPSSLQTYWFVGSILTELVLIYSIRTKGWFFRAKTFPSRILVWLTGIAGLVTVVLPFTRFGTEVLKFVVPDSDKLMLVAVIVAAYLVSTEAVKKLYATYVEPRAV